MMYSKTGRGQGRASVSDAKLLTWLEGNSKTSASSHPMPVNDIHNLGFASVLYDACLQVLADIWNICRRDPGTSRSDRALIRESLTRFVLWGDTFGDGRLDACLEQSRELRECVFETFLNIGSTLEKGTRILRVRSMQEICFRLRVLYLQEYYS